MSVCGHSYNLTWNNYITRKKVIQDDVLSESILETYQKIDHSIFNRMCEQWKLLLKLICTGKGSNNQVEAHHGLKVNLDQLPTVSENNSDDEETVREMVEKVKTEDDSLRVMSLLELHIVCSSTLILDLSLVHSWCN